MIKKILCCVVICGCLLCSGCEFGSDTYGSEHCHFRLIEEVNEHEGLYVHEEKGGLIL